MANKRHSSSAICVCSRENLQMKSHSFTDLRQTKQEIVQPSWPSFSGVLGSKARQLGLVSCHSIGHALRVTCTYVK